ncbi:FecR family protein [Parapedobacter indicus]|uniref:FecR family protein n=1 Tax=Parapedobacter indicus TaxID=1477437 RepID=A0A1I3FFS8_9SPHI|nr:FecR family protein [Parapedobacter indicus]PPL03700.1 FecR family protein [Parapedobacter indicus]SFI09952.1 FecR family protein [Parapedobacter indicus]
MTPQEVNRLAKKWQEGTIGAEERERFEQWYHSFDDTKLEIDSDEGETLMRTRLYRQIEASGMITDDRRLASRAVWWRYSAAAALLFTLFLFYWNHQNAFNDRPWITHIRVHAGATIKQEILPDGSIIWLKPGASLHYLKTFDTRNVELTGEALFEVSKIAGRPFSVRVGDYVATVLGTSFNIRQSDNQKDMEVVVLTGKVAVSKQQRQSEHKTQTTKTTTEVVLMSSQRLKTSGGLRPDAEPVETLDLLQENEYTQGTAYNMWFDDTPFKEVARRISMKFGVTVEVEGDRYSTCRISANLSDQPLEYSMELVAAALGAQYKQEKNKIILKGGGCL